MESIATVTKNTDQLIGQARYRMALMTMMLEWELEKLNPCEHFNRFINAVDEKYNQLSK